MGPGQPPIESKGKIRSRKIGDLWLVSEMNTDMMGTPITALQTLDYDAKSKKYAGS